MLAFAAVLLSLPNPSQRPIIGFSRDSVADVRAATTLLDEFKQAWHSADGVKLGSLFTEDGDLVIPTGELFHGRSKIAGFYNSVFAHGYRTSSTSASVVQLRHVTGSVMIVDATWEISGAVATNGTPKPVERGILSVTLKREGTRWLVDALREQTSATKIARL
ncbi:MAG TPA: SgcJ/EcaC family oxidoreductase [Gemmatimonadaceae bacterium]